MATIKFRYVTAIVFAADVARYNRLIPTTTTTTTHTHTHTHTCTFHIDLINEGW